MLYREADCADDVADVTVLPLTTDAVCEKLIEAVLNVALDGHRRVKCKL